MYKFLKIALAIWLAGNFSCGGNDGDSTVSNEPGATGAEQGTETSYTPMAGGVISVEGLGEVPVVSVGQFDENPALFAGLVAVEGRVAERFEDRFTFILVDCGRMDGCGSDCCSQATVPVRLARENYTGTLPALNDNVLVIGGLKVTEAGYELEVARVQRGSGTVLRKKEA